MGDFAVEGAPGESVRAAARIPRRVLIANASCGHRAAGAALAEDLADTLRAYDAAAGTAREVVLMDGGGVGSDFCLDAAEPAACVVLFDGEGATGPDGLCAEEMAQGSRLEWILDLPPAGTSVYGVLLQGGPRPAFDRAAIACAREAIDARGLRPAGWLAVSAAELVPLVAHTPRMGLLRRPVSEAEDRLAMAVRSGATVADAARTLGVAVSCGDGEVVMSEGLLEARCPVPRPLYPLVLRAYGAAAR